MSPNWVAAFHPFYHIVSLNCNELICTEGERGEGREGERGAL